MEPNQYKYMFDSENRHWWYVGNHENFINILKRNNILKKGVKILDAGCGTGRWLQILKSSFEISETGIDNNNIAIEYSKTRGNMNLLMGDINNCIFQESSFDLITSFDVVSSQGVNENIAIRNFYTYLKNEGYLLLTVPAFQFLYSKHDKVVYMKRRYLKKQIKVLLENNKLEIVKISYCVSLLFPLAVITRIFNKIFSSEDIEHNEVEMPPKVINRLFLMVMRIENYLLKYMSFPFGLSVLVLAKKKSSVI
ncbi:MAG: class I SAM-dependent methyltransferase [Bacteroidales bacterium]